MKLLCFLLLVLCLVGCTHSNDTAFRLLAEDGVTQVQLNGYAFFGCAKGDDFATEFSGVKNGKPVKGVLCGGFLKANTVRYF
jgi:hypothetical protein